MIIASLAHAHQYQLGPAFSEAITWLQANPSPSLGKYELSLCRLEVFTITPNIPSPDFSYEAHDNYADIHIVLEGAELIKCAMRSELVAATPFDANKDVGFFKATQAISTMDLHLLPQTFALLLPQDAHKPALASTNPKSLTKCVIKLPMAQLKPYLNHA